MTTTGENPTPEERESAERGRLLIAQAVAEERAPLTLRERLQADRERVRKPRRRRLAGVFAGAGAAAAAVVAALVIALGGGASTATVGAVAALSLDGHQQPPPVQAEARPKQLEKSVDGVAFPYWGKKFAWKATGTREDTVDGRRTATVFYAGKTGAEIGYSIVAGRALDVPTGRRVTKGETTFTVVDDGPRQIVTWRRDGRTCVISAPDGVPTAKLLELAAWDTGAPTTA